MPDLVIRHGGFSFSVTACLAHSKSASRLLSQLRFSNAPLKATLRRSLLRSSKSTIIATFRQLLRDHDWQIALPMYLAIADAPWFKWDAELLAELVALLTERQQTRHVEDLLETHCNRLDAKQNVALKCALILHFARYNLEPEMTATFRNLEVLPNAKLSALCSLLHAYAFMGRPEDAYAVLLDMQRYGLRPSSKDFRAVVFCFGKCGQFDEMENLVSDMEKRGFHKDVVLFNMIINTYATVQNHSKMYDWLGKMSDIGLQPSVRSLNAVAKGCPVLTKLARSYVYVPIGKLPEYLELNSATQGELQMVDYLLKVSPIEEAVKWETSWELDLHSATISSAYVILLCWLKEVFRKLNLGSCFASEISIVTGWGKHCQVSGDCSIKTMVRELLYSVGSPFMIDRQNKGTLSAKPCSVFGWLKQL